MPAIILRPWPSSEQLTDAQRYGGPAPKEVKAAKVVFSESQKASIQHADTGFTTFAAFFRPAFEKCHAAPV